MNRQADLWASSPQTVETVVAKRVLTRELKNVKSYSDPTWRQSIIISSLEEFSPLPRCSHLHVETLPSVIVGNQSYFLLEHKWKVVLDKFGEMTMKGVVEESHSDRKNSIVFVPMLDGSLCFCVDLRKLNAVSKCQAYPMPHIDQLWITRHSLF